jgi:hypothetical protein
MRAFVAIFLAWPLMICASELSPAEQTIQFHLGFDAKTRGICEVHHLRMQRRMVPIAFGLPAMGREWTAVYSRDFPHSLLHIEGGCILDQKLVRARFPLYVCRACKRAERAWAEKHRDTREARAILAGKDAIRPDDSSWIAATQ